MDVCPLDCLDDRVGFPSSNGKQLGSLKEHFGMKHKAVYPFQFFRHSLHWHWQCTGCSLYSAQFFLFMFPKRVGAILFSVISPHFRKTIRTRPTSPQATQELQPRRVCTQALPRSIVRISKLDTTRSDSPYSTDVPPPPNIVSARSACRGSPQPL